VPGSPRKKASRMARPATRWDYGQERPLHLEDLVGSLPPSAWEAVEWSADGDPKTSRFYRQRVHAAHGWAQGAWPEDEEWLLIEFAPGLRKDVDAVRAGLTLPWSQGKVEGHIQRLKLLKRQTYGRYSF